MLEKVIKKENEMLRAQSKKTQQKNEKLKEKIKELKAEKTDICKWATKWYTQKKALKEKYKNLKHELHVQKNAQAQKNIDALLQATEAQAGVTQYSITVPVTPSPIHWRTYSGTCEK